MIIEPWKASKNSTIKKYKTVRKQKLVCPFCQKTHRTIDSAHACALEVSKYGTKDLRERFAEFESRWLNWYNTKEKVANQHNNP